MPYSSTILAFMLVLAGSGVEAPGADPTRLQSSDWPEWRGPYRDGVSTDTGLLDSWDAGGPPMRWKASGLGEGFSTVSVVRRVIYTMGERDEASWLIALNEEDGSELWRSPVGTSSAAVVYADGHLYFRYESGLMTLIKATPEKYVLKGTFQIDSSLGESWSASGHRGRLSLSERSRCAALL